MNRTITINKSLEVKTVERSSEKKQAGSKFISISEMIAQYFLLPEEFTAILKEGMSWLFERDREAIVKLFIGSLHRAAEYESIHDEWGNQDYLLAVKVQLEELLSDIKKEMPAWEDAEYSQAELKQLYDHTEVK